MNIKKHLIFSKIVNFIVGIVFIASSSFVFANDGERLRQLENEIQEIKSRLSRIENLPPNSIASNRNFTSKDGWKQLTNWRTIKKGMTQDEIRNLLGDPENIRTSSNFTWWKYPKNGDVRFYDEKTDGWTEPRL